MNRLSDSEATYIASFIDCDGSIMAQMVPRVDYVLRYQMRVSVVFIQKTTRVAYLERIRDQIGVGIGSIRNKKTEQISDYTIVGVENVSNLLTQIRPHLRNKRTQADLVLSICDQLDQVKNDPYKFLELCNLADQVSALNDSRGRVHTASSVKQKFIELGLIKN